MSRPARVLSRTGMYHIIFCGINRQNLFEDEKDFSKLLEITEKVKKEFDFELYAYCFMTNHVHLFLKEKNKGDIKPIMHKILSVYVSWYNNKYQRSGSLIGNRYKSEPIENEKYYLSLIRYIHQNPLKANMVRLLQDYLWSSYNSYILEGNNSVVDTDFALEMFSKNKKNAVKAFKDFHKVFDDENFELSEGIRPTDEQLKRKMLEIADIRDLSEIALKDKKTRNAILRSLRNKGFSIRDIERLTGILRGVISRA